LVCSLISSFNMHKFLYHIYTFLYGLPSFVSYVFFSAWVFFFCIISFCISVKDLGVKISLMFLLLRFWWWFYCLKGQMSGILRHAISYTHSEFLSGLGSYLIYLYYYKINITVHCVERILFYNTIMILSSSMHVNAKRENKSWCF